MSYPSTTTSLETYRGSSDEDDEETPRANRIRSNPQMAYGPPPPQTDAPRAYEAPMNFYNDDFDEEYQRWNAQQSLMQHLRPAGSEEGSEYDHRSPSPAYHRRRRWWDFEEINTLDDWTACVGTWSLGCMTAIIIVGGAAVIWILVTQ